MLNVSIVTMYLPFFLSLIKVKNVNAKSNPFVDLYTFRFVILTVS